MTAALVLLAASVACHSSAPPARTSRAPGLDRRGLDSLLGRQWEGTSTPVSDSRFESGWLVEFRTDSGPIYGISIHSARGRRLLTFARAVPGPSPVPVWVTLDAAWLPRLTRRLRIASRCRYAQTMDDQVFAIVQYADRPRFTEVRAAWRANPATGRIEDAETRGLSCENEGWGG